MLFPRVFLSRQEDQHRCCSLESLKSPKATELHKNGTASFYSDRCNINIFKRFSIIINVRSHRRWRYLDVTNDGNSFSSITINVGSLEFRTATMSIVYSNNSIFNDTKMIIRNDFTSSRKRWKFFLRVQSMSTGSNLGHLRY
ncbi:uncharacterized protein LOC143154522 isoform X2 [Ptiloglossa arizonensis]|uniref:uncharacterized protein LOC143154522 isoform X2 n=1 Tax=Ptiloglossa arizonensis TaxID=3350558 RepID=UPI003FA0E07A